MLQYSGSFKKLRRWTKVAAGLLLAVLAGILALLVIRWPYTQERMIGAIESATGSSVYVGRYRESFFPEPGCTIENVTVQRHAQAPIAYVGRVSIRSSWLSLLTFRKRIRRIRAQGLRIQIASPFPAPITTYSPGGLGNVAIDEFVADGTTIDIAANGDRPARFIIHQLRLEDVSRNKPVAYATVLDIPDPPGQLISSGTVGPFSEGERSRTPVKGSFELRRASLDKYKGLAGSINGKGTLQGPLENIRVAGTAVASGFEVNRTGHPVDVRTAYLAAVNGLSGDVILEAIEAGFLGTRLLVQGAVNGKHGKIVSVQFLGDEARIEDLLAMFTRFDEPALAGLIRLRATVDLLPGDEPFLRRVLLHGSFGISNARWSKPLTQIKVNALSARARGDKKQVEERTADRVDHILSQLEGDVSMKVGVASLSRVSFYVPGATATGGGTYDLISKRVDLRGAVSMLADVSEATSGFKSLLLKPFDALFRHNGDKGATLPVSITGHYPKPKYRVGLNR